MASRAHSRRPPFATLARRWGAVFVLALVAYLYYNPLRTYLARRSDLRAARTDVSQLAAEKRALQRELAAATSIDELAREARRLGYVRPGEHLYIVKGISEWRRSAASIARHGR